MARIQFSAIALGVVAVLAAISPQGIHDPRSITYTAALGSEAALADVSATLPNGIRPGDILYPYASVFLAALPEAAKATALPRAQTSTLLDTLARIHYPAGALFVAVPTGSTIVRREEISFREVRFYRSWVVVRVPGPINGRVEVLQAAFHALIEVKAALTPPIPSALAGWFDLNLEVLCKSLSERSARCGTQ